MNLKHNNFLCLHMFVIADDLIKHIGGVKTMAF